GDQAELDISQVDLEIGLRAGQRVFDQQAMVWKPQVGWTDTQGLARQSVSFRLTGYGAQLGPSAIHFVTQTRITQGDRVVELHDERSLFDEASALSTPLASVDVVSVDGSDLPWSNLVHDSRVVRADLELSSGDQTDRSSLQTRTRDGVLRAPA